MNIRFSTLMILLWLAATQTGWSFYNPHPGTWLNRDPISEVGGNNLYAFVNNDPINQNDPDGLLPCNATEIATCQARAAKRGWTYTGCTALQFLCFRRAQCFYVSNPPPPPPPPPPLQKCSYICADGTTPVYTEQFPGQFSGGCPDVRAVNPETGNLEKCQALGPY